MPCFLVGDNAMLRSTLSALIAAWMIATSAHAAISFTIDQIDTPGLPGFKTNSVIATSDGAPIQGFDFVGDPTVPVDPATSRGFFGLMKQLNPGGLSTIWTDYDALLPILIPGSDARQDSKFLFHSQSLLIIPGSARESATSLQAAFSTTTSFGQSVKFAQIVSPIAGAATTIYRGVVRTTDGSEFPVSGLVVPGPLIPLITPVDLGEVKQTTTILARLDMGGAMTWSDLTPVAGSPAIPATLTTNGAFSWDPSGSPRGPKGNGVLYSWSATVTNASGSSTGIVLTLALVPEPTTLMLCVIMIACTSSGSAQSSGRDRRSSGAVHQRG
jgi:hypothetical protein